MPNMETRLAWDCHAEYFEYYALECPDSWLDLSKQYFIEEHGQEECSKIDWFWIGEQVQVTIDYLQNQYGG